MWIALLSEMYQTIVDKGAKIRYNFEGKTGKGVVLDENYDKRVVQIKLDNGEIFWTHVSHVSLDR